MIILLLLSATGHAWPQQPVDTAKLAGLAKLAGALAGGRGENEGQRDIRRPRGTKEGHCSMGIPNLFWLSHHHQIPVMFCDSNPC